MASFVEVCRYNNPNKRVPVYSTSLPCVCPCRISTRRTLILPHFSEYSSLRLVRDAKPKPLFRSRAGRISFKRRFLTAVARAESDQLGDDYSKVFTLSFFLLLKSVIMSALNERARKSQFLSLIEGNSGIQI